MSFEAMRWAIGVRAPSSAAKLLLLALADLVRPPAMKAFASAATLGDTTQLDRKTVLSGLKRLEEAMLILRTGETAGKGGAPVFQLLMKDSPTDTGNGTTSPPEHSPTTRTTDTGNGIASSTSRRTKPMPDFPSTDTVFPANQYRFSLQPVPKTGHKPVPSIEPVLTQEKKGAHKSATPSTSPEQFFPDVDLETLTDWQAVRKAKKAGPITSTVAKILRKQAAEAGLSVQGAVEFCCGRAWQNFNATWYANTDATSTRGRNAQSGRSTQVLHDVADIDYSAGLTK